MADARYNYISYSLEAVIVPLTLTILDLHKTYIDDESYYSGHGQAYEKYGISTEEGAVIVVRPDQCMYSYFQECIEILLIYIRCFTGHDTVRLSDHWKLFWGLFSTTKLASRISIFH